LIARIILICLLFFSMLGATLFGAAGTFDYPGAWILLAIFLAIGLGLFSYYLRTDPDFLRKRMDYSEREKPQRLIVSLSLLPFMAVFVVPALDRRFGWTTFSWPLVYAGAVVFVSGYVLLMIVFRANRYAARTVKIQEGQKVIDSGPYALVRHPMYLSVLPIYAGIPLILQSAWGLLALPFMVAVLVARILNEEKILKAGLGGYADYMKKTRWRLLPFIW
jgi:protein-S-isoprenylcysteine O-methyltransferase Ste14